MLLLLVSNKANAGAFKYTSFIVPLPIGWSDGISKLKSPAIKYGLISVELDK